MIKYKHQLIYKPFQLNRQLQISNFQARRTSFNKKKLRDLLASPDGMSAVLSHDCKADMPSRDHCRIITFVVKKHSTPSLSLKISKRPTQPY